MTSPTVSPRNLGLDSVRTLAILGMMASHTSRMIPFLMRPPWSIWILLVEPVIPSLFMLMVGISLTLSLQAYRAKFPGASAKPWYLRQVRRAGMLWCISLLFYLLEMGPRLPDTLVLTGILATISYAILFVGALLLLPSKKWPIREWVVGLALLAGGALFLRVQTLGIFPLTVGDAPLLPMLPFTLAGALWGLLRPRFPKLVFWLGLPVAALSAWLIHHYGLQILFSKPFGRLDAGRDLPAPLFVHGEAKHVGYYNLGPLLAICCLGIHLGALSLSTLLNRVTGKAAAILSPFAALGRHSLTAYVFHLTLLASLVETIGFQPLKTAKQGTWTLAGVMALTWAVCLLLDKRSEKRRARILSAG